MWAFSVSLMSCLCFRSQHSLCSCVTLCSTYQSFSLPCFWYMPVSWTYFLGGRPEILPKPLTHLLHIIRPLLFLTWHRSLPNSWQTVCKSADMCLPCDSEIVMWFSTSALESKFILLNSACLSESYFIVHPVSNLEPMKRRWNPEKPVSEWWGVQSVEKEML